jgi:GT2 family glycosyltransferase
MKDVKVLVLIVTHNGSQWIQKCINSVLQSDTDVDVYVVDNCSSDNTLQLLQAFDSKRVTVHQSDENLGFGKANNLGMEYFLRHEYENLFLLNQDAYVKQETIKTLKSRLDEQPSIGLLSPVHLNGQGDALDEAFEKYCKNGIAAGFLSDLFFHANRDKLYDIDFVNAAGWMLSRECLKQVGGFAPLFYHYGEDKNYVHRVKYHGFRVAVHMDSFIMHDREMRVDNSFKTDRNLIKERFLKNHYANPNPGRKDLIRPFVGEIFADLLSLKFGEVRIKSKELRRMVKIKKIADRTREETKRQSCPYLA